MTWHSTRAADALPREHVGEAIRAGGRYIAASPVLRVILARAGLFIAFASAIWALLPLIAQSTLHLGAGGYGLLLGTVGIGAVAGAALLPRLRARLSPGWPSARWPAWSGGSAPSRRRPCCPPETGPRRCWPPTRRRKARCWLASSTGRGPDSKIS